MKIIEFFKKKLTNFNKNRCKIHLHLFPNYVFYNENGRTYRISRADFLARVRRGHVWFVEYDKNKKIIREEFVW